MALVLADVLDPQQVVLQLRARTLEAALREIIATMEGEEKVPSAVAFLGEVLAREGDSSTYLGHGVAFPHARTDLVSRILLGVGRSTEGLEFGANGERAELIFVIAVPRRMVTDYLVCVGALARLTKNQTTRAALKKAGTAEEFVQILREGSLLLE